MTERTVMVFKTRAVHLSGGGGGNAHAELRDIAERARETGQLTHPDGSPISSDCLPSINEQLAFCGEPPIALKSVPLTVAQLIAELAKYPGDMPVQMHVGGDDYYAQSGDVDRVEFRTMLGDRQNPGLFLLDGSVLEGTDQKFPPELAARCTRESCAHLGAAHNDKGCHVLGCNCPGYAPPAPAAACSSEDWEDTLP